MALIKTFPSDQVLSKQTSHASNVPGVLSKNLFHIIAVLLIRVMLVVHWVQLWWNTAEWVLIFQHRFKKGNIYDIMNIPMHW